jgi:hypothetical protein
LKSPLDTFLDASQIKNPLTRSNTPSFRPQKLSSSNRPAIQQFHSLLYLLKAV